MSTPPAEATRLVSRAFAAGVPFHKALKTAKVGRSTWWRIRKGEDYHVSTLTRIDEAITALIEEKETQHG